MNKTASLPLEAKTEYFVKFEQDELQTTIVDRFEKQAALYPDNLAIKDGDTSLTYAEFNTLTNLVAHYILEKMGDYRGPIAFLLEHGASQMVAIFGILKSGNGYVALDPDFPRARLEFMISDSETPLMITNSKNLNFARELSSPGIQIISLDEINSGTQMENPGLDIDIDAMIAIYYTSGSTGQPKGCVLPHKLIMHNVMSSTNRRYLNPKDRQIFLFSASFAASAGPIFSTLLNGACLYPYEIKKQGLVKLVNFIVKEGITIFSSVPSTFRYFATLLDPEKTFPDVRLVTMGGDTVLKKDIDLFKKYFPSSCYFLNSLGGTEFFGICSFVISKDTQIEGGIVPIGYELEDKKVQLLDDEGSEVPTGEVGEIVVQSKYVSNGYWRRPELTKEKFNLVPGQDGVIQYRTGDLGRMDSDGCLYHLGRKDRQVKIRGHRVELAEIISVLQEIAVVKDAYVKANTDSAGENKLVAYIVPEKQSGSLVEQVQEELSECLPTYMIPTEFMVLDEIPRTPSRKVDALALPELERNHSSHQIDCVEPRNSVERKLVEIWETLLDFQPIGVKDDFFELGGHSLLALRLIAEIEDKFEVTVPFAALVQVRTIRELATILEDKNSLHKWSHLVALQPLGTKIPFFCVPPSAVTVMIFKDLAKHMSEERPFYALEYTGMDEGSETHKSIAAMASFNIEKIRSVQPEGPYYLGGMCFGGIVAYEMAKQLLEAGDRVAFLGILDSTHAPYLSRPRSYHVFMLTRFINQKVLRQKFPIGMAPLERAMKKFAPDDEFSQRIYDVFTTHNYARVKYVTTPYPETITLFNTAGSRGDFSRDKWREVAGGKLEIVSIPGVHGGARVDLQEGEQSFIHEPMVQVFAKRLNESLEAAV